MTISKEQKETITKWIADGFSISDVQSKMDSEFGISMTYMEVRFLIDDLNLEIKDATPATKDNVNTEEKASTQSETNTAQTENTDAGVNNLQNDINQEKSTVSISIDPVQTAGVLVGGSVTFSNGTLCKWVIDNSGQFGFSSLPENYRPSKEDLMQFQTILRSELSKLGF